MALASAPHVLIYTTPTCPDCRSLKLWLASQGVHYIEFDLTDPEIAHQAKSDYGVRVAPVTLVDGAVVYGTFASQLPHLRALLARSEAA